MVSKPARVSLAAISKSGPDLAAPESMLLSSMHLAKRAWAPEGSAIAAFRSTLTLAFRANERRANQPSAKHAKLLSRDPALAETAVVKLENGSKGE